MAEQAVQFTSSGSSFIVVLKFCITLQNNKDEITQLLVIFKNVYALFISQVFILDHAGKASEREI